MDHVQGFTQWPTYPQLLVNGELVGGCDIITEMQQDGSLKTAVQEALGAKLDANTALQQRIKHLLDSSPVVLFMKVYQLVPPPLQLCNLPSRQDIWQGQPILHVVEDVCCAQKAFASIHINRHKTIVRAERNHRICTDPAFSGS